MRRSTPRQKATRHSRSVKAQTRSHRNRGHRAQNRPSIAFGQRGGNARYREPFNAPERWHEPTTAEDRQFIVEPPGEGYVHPVSVNEVRQRIDHLPAEFTESLHVVQFSRVTRKRSLFPCYGMQWGNSVYLYPIEDSLSECYGRPPTPQQRIDAEMFGGEWHEEDGYWLLQWTEQSIRDFYLNNVLIHEIGHIHDTRNTNAAARERYANWFAIEHGYRATRCRLKG